MQIWANKDDCRIVRHDDQAHVIDGDGDEFFAVPSDWTDEAVWRVFHIANRSYDFGHNAGDLTRAALIRAALGLSDEGREIERLKVELKAYEQRECAFDRALNEALNSGDGSYRP